MYTEIPRHKSLTLYDPDPDWTTEEILEYQRVTEDEFEFLGLDKLYAQQARAEEHRLRFLAKIRRRLVRKKMHFACVMIPKHPKATYKLEQLRERVNPEGVYSLRASL